MKERFFRIEALRLTTADIAGFLDTSEDNLARWIAGLLPVEEADIIEVGLSLLETTHRHVFAEKIPTLRLSCVA